MTPEIKEKLRETLRQLAYSNLNENEKETIMKAGSYWRLSLFVYEDIEKAITQALTAIIELWEKERR